MSLLPLRRALHPVGQHRARHADLVPAYREGPAPRRTIPTASSASARWSAPPPRPSTSSPATISGRRATWPRAACTSALDVDRADPENRAFKHPDPIGWTENHRAEILAALYTILLGNPQLKAPRDADGKTRFKMWWRLVGSAVEHAARADRAGARLPEIVHRAGGGRRGIGIARRRARGPGEEVAGRSSRRATWRG